MTDLQNVMEKQRGRKRSNRPKYNYVLEVIRKMKKIVKVAALTFCVMFLCVFGFQTAYASSTEVIKNGDIENALTDWTEIGRASCRERVYTPV